MAPFARALVPNGLLDAVHLLLVPALVLHGALLGLLQCTLQGLNSLSRSPKSFFQLRKLTTQICIVTYQLWDEPQRRGGERGEQGSRVGGAGGRENKEKSCQGRWRPCRFLQRPHSLYLIAVLASSFLLPLANGSQALKSYIVFQAAKTCQLLCSPELLG